MNCESARPLINALIDDQIESADRIAVEEHLSVCAECQAAADDLRKVNASLSGAFSLERDAALAVAENVIAALPMEELSSAELDSAPASGDEFVREVRRADWRSLALAGDWVCSRACHLSSEVARAET